MRSMVEGQRPETDVYDVGPSTALRAVPLPTASPQGGLLGPLPIPKPAIKLQQTKKLRHRLAPLPRDQGGDWYGVGSEPVPIQRH